MVKRYLIQGMFLKENVQKLLPPTVSTEDVRMDPRVRMDGVQPAAEDTPLNGLLVYHGPVRISTCLINFHKHQ